MRMNEPMPTARPDRELDERPEQRVRAGCAFGQPALRTPRTSRTGRRTGRSTCAARGPGCSRRTGRAACRADVERLDAAEPARQHCCARTRRGLPVGQRRADRLARVRCSASRRSCDGLGCCRPVPSANCSAARRAYSSLPRTSSACVPCATMRPWSITTMRSALQHGREPVRDDDRRAVLHQPLERLLHQPLALGVERARRLVEQQDRRVAQDRARDRDALPLSARESRAALAEERVVALRQLAEELVGGGRAAPRPRPRHRSRPGGRSGCSRARSPRTARCPAARGRCGGAPASGSAVRDVDAVDQDAARGRVVEAQQQLERRALARARGPDERDGLARAHREVEVVERLRLRAATDSGT